VQLSSNPTLRQFPFANVHNCLKSGFPGSAARSRACSENHRPCLGKRDGVSIVRIAAGAVDRRRARHESGNMLFPGNAYPPHSRTPSVASQGNRATEKACRALDGMIRRERDEQNERNQSNIPKRPNHIRNLNAFKNPVRYLKKYPMKHIQREGNLAKYHNRSHCQNVAHWAVSLGS